MHTRLSTIVALGLTGALFVACSNSDGNDDSGGVALVDASGTSLDGPSNPTGPDAGLDGGLGCCPTGFVLYSCTLPGDGGGFACHNPAMGCPSSSMCGAGCDPQVSGRCGCVETQLCIAGDHFDRDLCRCVPDAYAGGPTMDGGTPGRDAACVENVLCIRGDHFDRNLCRCVPDFDGGAQG
jgi:hypothetical protein